ncbi:Glycosyltransferase involved in cell wall bisynthesis [Belliella buryatensis]|uniref:Glycosyltransferase involved in cell wall bisynthesis n=1 Tax=Belliella buryatensis TaxID=1500549 RepID=A0A239BHI1_9BACT|nr:glycosyltransferase [Belliella buryatensis]SNS07627.1 Glycosyltransferase involved in cell wall bisynthesis [Belliella buryatensis]
MKKSQRILVLNQPFDNQTGGGVTLSNLFAGVDPDQIAVVCGAQLINEYTDFGKSHHYYQLGSLEQRWTFPFNQLSSKNFSGEMEANGGITGSKGSVLKKDSWKGALVNEMVFPMIKYLGIYQAYFVIKPSESLLVWIDRFEPTLVYAQANNIQQLRFCQEILEALDIPFVFHMMDDWVSLGGQSVLSKIIWKKSTEGLLRKLFGSCDQVLTVSDYMSEEYLSRYGIASEVFHNPVDDEFWSMNQKTNLELAIRPTILYAGRTGLGIDASLVLMARAVSTLNESLKQKISFVVQTQNRPDWIGDFEHVTYKEQAPYGDLPRIFANADLLFLPYDFSEASLQFIKYSMPTKASEYMVCGTPILIMAPKDTAVVKSALKLGWGYVLNDNRVEKLVESLKIMLFDPIARLRLSESARNVARNYHTKSIVQARFFKTLDRCTKQQ